MNSEGELPQGEAEGLDNPQTGQSVWIIELTPVERTDKSAFSALLEAKLTHQKQSFPFQVSFLIVVVDILGHCTLLSWGAAKQLNHSKNVQGSSPPSSLLTSGYQVGKAKSTSLKIKRIEVVLPRRNPRPLTKQRNRWPKYFHLCPLPREASRSEGEVLSVWDGATAICKSTAVYYN